jgi:hypothetical protein
MCLKFNRIANRIPEASLFPWEVGQMVWIGGSNTHIPSHEDGPEQNPEHKAVVLEMNVIHDKETRMQEERGGDDSLGRRVNCPSYEARSFLSTEKESSEDDTPQ